MRIVYVDRRDEEKRGNKESKEQKKKEKDEAVRVRENLTKSLSQKREFHAVETAVEVIDLEVSSVPISSVPTTTINRNKKRKIKENLRELQDEEQKTISSQFGKFFSYA